MKKLENKVAVVTGASKGIGAGVAKRLAAAGAHVVVNYSSSKEGADKVVAEITANGGIAVAIQANVSKEADITRLFLETEKSFGKVDILVNNAGVFNFKPLEEVNAEDFYFMFDTNVLGMLLTTKEAVMHFNDGGSIINIGSIAATLAPPGCSIYCASKGAVDIITKCLSKELAGRRIRVNSINPGMVETEGNRSENGIMGTPIEQMMLSMTLLRRAGQPDDMGDVATFLASDDARFITGELIRVTGGMA
jgi:3-oxoacyl-[acyl-carrier protein] reductase